MVEFFYFSKIKFFSKKPKIFEILGILGFFISKRKRGEVYRGISSIFQNFYFMVPRVFLKALKSKKFPEVKDE